MKTGINIQKWADPAMFTAAPLAEDGELVKPEVTLVSMTPNPLRVIAAVCEMYKGNPVSDPATMDKETSETTFNGIAKSRLQAPLEFVDLHFLISGVSRAFTHQMVRQRTAVYAQESLRFAVKDRIAAETVLPPSLVILDDDDPRRVMWIDELNRIGDTYNSLINAGVPAEDARGLAPTNIATRLHYKTNLKNLAEQSGNRLCSQAQAEWKQVWLQIIRAIHNYGPSEERWQQYAIGRLFKPVCYQTGKCEFLAPTDRYCVIRERVQAHHKAGESPDQWGDIDPRAPLHHLAAVAPR